MIHLRTALLSNKNSGPSCDHKTSIPVDTHVHIHGHRHCNFQISVVENILFENFLQFMEYIKTFISLAMLQNSLLDSFKCHYIVNQN